jgi:hypothetical protein
VAGANDSGCDKKKGCVVRLLLSVPAVALLWLSGLARAESPVHFADSTLKATVEKALWISDPTPSDMLALTSLTCPNAGITSLTGLEYAKNLHELSVTDSSITDLSPLAGLTNLRSLNFNDNEVEDISALSGLSSLQTLSMEDNLVSDISPLLNLRSLRFLDVRDIPLEEDAYQIDIPQIVANNPGIQVLHDRAQVHLILSAGRGGSIVSPGEGDFLFNGRTDIWVEAKADPGFVFAGFSGTVSSARNPLFYTLQFDCHIRADFVSVLRVIHVDDDAPADPAADNAAISDPQENGTPEHPFDSIQEAIDVATNGAVVLVSAGTYRECIDLQGKRIELTGFNPDDSRKAAWPVIDGSGSGGPVVSFTHGEDPNCVLQGFVITGGKAALAAITCSGSSPTIANCLIVGNRAMDAKGAAVYCTDSNAMLMNCTIADNYAGGIGPALYLDNSPVRVLNSILWGDTPAAIVSSGARMPSVRYSCIAGGWPGLRNIAGDPLFAGAGSWVDANNPSIVVTPDHPDAIWVMGDYHLQSQVGRWDPGLRQWVQDAVTSPCIDAGDPASPVGDEPPPNGDIIDMGAYGGTAEAAR